MKKYGLPTYPIHNGMNIGERDNDELIWLLKRGRFLSTRLGEELLIEMLAADYFLIKKIYGTWKDTQNIAALHSIEAVNEFMNVKDQYGGRSNSWYEDN